MSILLLEMKLYVSTNDPLINLKIMQDFRESCLKKMTHLLGVIFFLFFAIFLTPPDPHIYNG